MSLDPLRQKIDSIDAELVKLLIERATTAAAIGQTKKLAGQPIRDPEREAKVLQGMRSRATDPLKPDDLEQIYRTIINVCSDVQERA
jgi:chorismate mutase/prephenate dehydratase